MTDIDPRGDIGIVYQDDDLVALIPLAGEVSEMWRLRYEALARARGVRIRAYQPEGAAFIRVSVPVRTGREDVVKTLDTARELIAEADSVDQSPATSNSPEAIARRWWASQQETGRGQRSPGSNQAP